MCKISIKLPFKKQVTSYHHSQYKPNKRAIKRFKILQFSLKLMLTYACLFPTTESSEAVTL